MHFKTWFENTENVSPFVGSTVPYLVYHGTNKNHFSKFQYQKSQRSVLFASFDVQANGFFFSESPHDALQFGKNVAACYINLKNPLLDPRRDKHLSINELSPKKELDIMKILAPMIEKDQKGHYIDYMIHKRYLQHDRRSSPREWLYDAVDSGGIVWDVLDNPKTIQKMIELGYDGTFVSEPDTYLGRSIFIPSAEQIRIVKWIKEPQENWGEKEDWYTKKKDGFEQLFTPEIKER